MKFTVTSVYLTTGLPGAGIGRDDTEAWGPRCHAFQGTGHRKYLWRRRLGFEVANQQLVCYFSGMFGLLASFQNEACCCNVFSHSE